MRKIKFLLLILLFLIILLLFVVVKCNIDVKVEDMNRDKLEKDKMVSELIKNNELINNNDKNSSNESNVEKSNIEFVIKKIEKDIKSEEIIKSEMFDMFMKKVIKLEVDKRLVNDVDVLGYDIGRWYDKISKEDLNEFKEEFEKILNDIEVEIKNKVKN